MPKKKVITKKTKNKISKKKIVLDKKTKSLNITKKSKAKTNPLELIFKENEIQLISLITKEFDKEFLGFLPLNEDLRTSADNGEPLTYSKPDHKISKIFLGIAKKIRQSFL